MSGWDGRGPSLRAPLLSVLVVALALVVAVLASAPAADARQRPNIVVIQVDDAVTGDLRFMPKIRRQLIQRGVRFRRFFNSYPLCCPARTTLLTGQFAHNHRVLSNFQANDGGHYTFSSLPGELNQSNSLGPWMQSAGYRTALVGKYLNEYGALDRREVPPGWDHWAALIDHSTYDYFNYAMNIDGKVRFWGDRDYARQQLELATLGATDPPESFAEFLALFREAFVPFDSFGSARPRDYSMDTNGRIAARFISEAAPSRRPFFLYYAPPAPHAEDTNHLQGLRPGAPGPDPRPPYRYRDEFADAHAPRSPAFNEADVSDKASNIRDLPKLTRAQIDEIDDNYRGRLGALRSVDDQLGLILRRLRRAGELRNTYIIFNSDNGYIQGEHRLRGSKFLPFESSIRVPTVIRGPGVRRGQKIDGNAIDVDLAPTILDIAGAEPGRTMDGISLLGAARKGRRLPRRDVPLEALRPLFRFVTPVTAFDVPYYAVRAARFKYVRWSFGESELYHLRRDPYELENLAGDPAYADVVARLEARAAALQECAGSSCR